MNRNYYEILGIDKGAEQKDIKKAYRKLSKQHHPDHGGDEEKFKEINEAYSTLSDPEKRADYDNPMGQMGGFSFDDLFGGPNGPRGPFRAPNPNAPRRGRNIVLEHPVLLRYFIFGGKLGVDFSFKDPCPDCTGTGAAEKQTCTNCKGTGHVVQTQHSQGMTMRSATACPTCHGRGFTASKQCELCKGSGSRTTNKKIKFEIPMGISEGHVVGAAGEGGIGLNGGPPGDLIVKLYIQMPKAKNLTEEQRKVLEEL